MAFHTWGHDSGCWTRMSRFLDDGIELLSWDRGYFYDSPSDPSFSGDGLKVIMAHAFGLHLVPPPMFSKVDGIILISPFVHFGKDQMVNRMVETLRTNTALLLGQYHANCAYPLQSSWSMPRVFSRDILSEDLIRLRDHQFKTSILPPGLPKLALAGEFDKVVEIKDQQAFCRELGLKLNLLEKSGHGLIYTKPQECAGLINGFLGKLESQNNGNKNE